MESLKHLGAVLGFCFLTSTPLFAQTGFSFAPTDTTPYDSQLDRIEHLLLAARRAPDVIPTLEQVNHWMNQLKCVPYKYSNVWQTPEEMKAMKAGDCKAKAVTLYYLMRANGAKNVLLVVGRKTVSSPTTHVWLVWNYRGNLYILDPTHEREAVLVGKPSPDVYIAHFAYAAGKRLRPTAG